MSGGVYGPFGACYTDRLPTRVKPLRIGTAKTAFGHKKQFDSTLYSQGRLTKTAHSVAVSQICIQDCKERVKHTMRNSIPSLLIGAFATA
jgi:hypothetical protein